MMISLIPGQIRQPRKQPLQTFLNTSKFRKSKNIGIWTQLCPTCLFLQTGVSVTTAMEAGMLPLMDDEEARCFTPGPTEVLLC